MLLIKKFQGVLLPCGDFETLNISRRSDFDTLIWRSNRYSEPQTIININFQDEGPVWSGTLTWILSACEPFLNEYSGSANDTIMLRHQHIAFKVSNIILPDISNNLGISKDCLLQIPDHATTQVFDTLYSRLILCSPLSLGLTHLRQLSYRNISQVTRKSTCCAVAKNAYWIKVSKEGFM